MDIIKESQAREQYDQIKSFVQGTVADKAPVIPISAQLKYNVDVSILLELLTLMESISEIYFYFMKWNFDG